MGSCGGRIKPPVNPAASFPAGAVGVFGSPSPFRPLLAVCGALVALVDAQSLTPFPFHLTPVITTLGGVVIEDKRAAIPH